LSACPGSRLRRQRFSIYGKTRELSSCCHVFFHQHGREGEHVGDIVKAVSGIVQWKFIGGRGGDSEQIANRVVIFHAIQPPDRHSRRRLGNRRGRGLSERILDPTPQRALFAVS
jgi:hypothetical protein